MKKLLFKVIFVSAFAFVLTISANAQQQSKLRTGSATLSGTIYDMNGAVIAKAKIVFQSNFNEIFSAESNNEGVYSISLPFNPIDPNSDSQTLKYKIIVDLEDKGFQKKIINDFSIVSPLKGKMFLDIALDSTDPEPCGVAGAGLGCGSSESIELKEPETKITDKISPKPLIKTTVESNQKKEN